ncbi:MAG: hypothetical protein ACOC44_18015 [Promethearchaeia archaeon]
MLKKLGGKDIDDLKRDYPSYVFVALARRGMEKINLDQCFLEGCDNTDKKKLEVIKIEEKEEKDKTVKKVQIKCHECGGTFIFKLDTIKKVAKPTSLDKNKSEEEQTLSMGVAYVLDENGKNLGHLGYF